MYATNEDRKNKIERKPITGMAIAFVLFFLAVGADAGAAAAVAAAAVAVKPSHHFALPIRIDLFMYNNMYQKHTRQTQIPMIAAAKEHVRVQLWKIL